MIMVISILLQLVIPFGILVLNGLWVVICLFVGMREEWLSMRLLRNV